MCGHRHIGRMQLRRSDVIRKDVKGKGVNIEEAPTIRTCILKTGCAVERQLLN